MAAHAERPRVVAGRRGGAGSRGGRGVGGADSMLLIFSGTCCINQDRFIQLMAYQWQQSCVYPAVVSEEHDRAASRVDERTVLLKLQSTLSQLVDDLF